MNPDQQALPFEPKVVAFCCSYCAYTAADLAGSMRLAYPSNVRVVKLECSGRIDPILLLRALEDGADAVYVAGCAMGDCHFLEGNLQGIRAVAYTRKLLGDIGLEPQRLEFFHIPASAGPLFAQRAEEMTSRARELGKSPLRDTVRRKAGTKLTPPPDQHPPLPPAKHGQRVRGEQRVANNVDAMEGVQS